MFILFLKLYHDFLVYIIFIRVTDHRKYTCNLETGNKTKMGQTKY
jgi:hypothetical protein